MQKKTFVKREKRREPSARAGHILSAVPSRGEIWLAGGYSDAGPLEDVWKHDVATGAWSEVLPSKRGKPTPLPRMEFTGCLLGDGDGVAPDVDTIFSSVPAQTSSPAPRIFVFGGVQVQDEQVLILNDLWSLDCSAPDARWTLISEECPISERSGHVAVTISADHMLVHGGDCMGAREDTWLYTASTNVWQQADTHPTALALPKPCGRTAHSACYCPEIEAMAIFGGIYQDRGEGAYLNDLWLFHCGASEGKGPAGPGEWYWSMVQCSDIAPSPRDLPLMHYTDGLGLIVFGGFGLQEVEVENAMEEEQEQQQQRQQQQEQEQGLIDGIVTSEGAKISEEEATASEEAPVSTLENCSLEEATSAEEREENAGAMETEISAVDGENGESAEDDEAAAVVGVEDEDEADDGEDDDENDDEDDDEGAELITGYLDDAWLISLPRSSAPSDPTSPGECASAEDFDLAAAAAASSAGPSPKTRMTARRGCRTVAIGDGGVLFSFGGFDGDFFFGAADRLVLSKIKKV